jgi:hypothetical protein
MSAIGGNNVTAVKGDRSSKELAVYRLQGSCGIFGTKSLPTTVSVAAPQAHGTDFGYSASIAVLASFHLSVAALNLCTNDVTA